MGIERPEPKVGQVWKSAQGDRFIVKDKFRGMFMLVFEIGDWTHGNVQKPDTYVGEFGGFKIRGESE